MKAIVTVKLPRNPKHNPHNKQIGQCPLCRPPFQPFDVQGRFTCTDITGEHHSYIEYGNDLEDIAQKAQKKYGHITRIEAI